MNKYNVKTVVLHDSTHLLGVNFGNNITTGVKGARVFIDCDRALVLVQTAVGVGFIPITAVKSGDFMEVPDDIKDFLGISKITSDEQSLPPYMRKSTPDVSEEQPVTPEDFQRQAARQRSMNANKPSTPSSQTNDLIQTSRMTAMGFKNQKSAQVQTAQQVGQSTVTGKPKVTSHAQLQAIQQAQAQVQANQQNQDIQQNQDVQRTPG